MEVRGHHFQWAPKHSSHATVVPPAHLRKCISVIRKRNDCIAYVFMGGVREFWEGVEGRSVANE